MKIIERDYLKELIDVIGTPDIKVITGVRRSGKSKLLDMFKSYIKKNLNNIILGPTFCTIPRVNNVYFMQIIIKYKNTSDIRDSLLFLKERYFNSKVRLDIDLNPFKI